MTSCQDSGPCQVYQLQYFVVLQVRSGVLGSTQQLLNFLSVQTGMQGAKDASRSFHSGQVKSNIMEKKKKIQARLLQTEPGGCQELWSWSKSFQPQPSQRRLQKPELGERAAAFVPQTNLI